jgi:hypothetical protein
LKIRRARLRVAMIVDRKESNSEEVINANGVRLS